MDSQVINNTITNPEPEQIKKPSETNVDLKPIAEESSSIGNAGLASIAAAALLLEACGGGNTASPTASEAVRFLTQATPGANRTLIAEVQSLGYAAWLDKQLAMPASLDTHWDWLMTHSNPNIDPSKIKPFSDIANRYANNGFQATAWRKLLTAPDALRQRIAFALSEIVVVSLEGLTGDWTPFSAAGYLDLLEKHAFGNYRDLLLAISTDTTMGQYLTFLGNTKADATTGSLPDENYARELMQLFTIGLVQLNIDGTPKLVNGAVVETYVQDDVSQLARIFTGWTWGVNHTSANKDYPIYVKGPMMQQVNVGGAETQHETGTSTFLGSTVGDGLNGLDSLNRALDIIFAHPNVAPFVCRQLIQRLVTSNPTPAYVGRVATIFNDNGKGIKGDLTAVIKAILLDDQARNKANLTNLQFGKVREPMLRFTTWARAFNVTSKNQVWSPQYLNSPSLFSPGQSPLRSPTVFNFFRPAYVPPNSSIATEGLVAPEFQLSNESTTILYINYMGNQIMYGCTYQTQNSTANLTVDYENYTPLIGTASLLDLALNNTTALVNELNLLLAANQLSVATVAIISKALNGVTDTPAEIAIYRPPSSVSYYLKRRIYAAILMVIASPEFIVSK